MAIGYASVRVNITSFVVDGIDSDDLPDDAPLTAKLTLSPMIQPGRTLQYNDAGRMKLKAVAPIVVDIGATGDINHQGRDFVKVVAPTAGTTNLARLQWRADFTDIRLGGALAAVKIDPIYFWVDPDAEINIADHVNVAASTAVSISRGARGFGIVGFETVDGDLVPLYESADGVIAGEPIALSAVVSDASVSSLVADDESATRAALAGVVAPKLDKTEAAETYAPVDSVPAAYQAYVAANSAVGPATRVTPLDAIDAYGESTTESVGSNWPATLAELIGVPVTNRGVSGQGAADILARTGLLRPQVTLSGNAIPASGPVTVTAIDPAKGWRIGGSGSFAYTGTIAGVEGSLNHNMVAEVWTFTRTTPGPVVAVNPGTEFIRKESLTTPYNRMILGTGRNNVLDGTLPLVQDLIGLAVTKIRTQIKKYLIWGVINGTNEPTGHARHTQIAAFNTAMAATHGANFYDIRRDFIDNGLEIAGITPTSGDTTNIAADCPPPSLMADAIHPNTAGYEVIAVLIAEKLLALGWISSINYPDPPVPDPVVLTSDSFNRADTASGVLGSTDAAAGGLSLPWASDVQLQILSNQLGHTSVSATRFCRVDLAALVASGDFDPADYDLNNYYVEMTVTGGLTDGGVHGRWLDNNNYYSARAQSNGTIGLDAKLAGSTIPLETTAAGVAVLGDKIGLWVRNEGETVSLTVYRNRIQILQRLGDTRILTGKKVGIRSSFSNAAARYEDFAVWDRFPGLTP